MPGFIFPQKILCFFFWSSEGDENIFVQCKFCFDSPQLRRLTIPGEEEIIGFEITLWRDFNRKYNMLFFNSLHPSTWRAIIASCITKYLNALHFLQSKKQQTRFNLLNLYYLIYRSCSHFSSEFNLWHFAPVLCRRISLLIKIPRTKCRFEIKRMKTHLSQRFGE